jgi:dienelactone hydrolase
MSVSATGLMAEDTAEREVTFQTSDRWQITGSLYVPRSQARVPGVVLVHGSRHESDAYGNLAAPGIPQTLSRRGVETLRIDIRGRGASHEPRAFQALAPAEREAVRLDVEAAISFLASQPGGDARRIGVVAEQDSANAAVLASAKDRRVLASILISGRLSRAAKEAIAASHAPVYCLVSKEDRRGFQDMTDAYLSSKSAHSRLRVFEGLALGTTMFSAWRHEFPHEPPIDELAAVWLAERLSAAVNVSGGRARKR